MGMNRIQLKLHAKESLRGASPHPMLLTLVYILIPLGISVLVNQITGGALYAVDKIEDPTISGIVLFLTILIGMIRAVLLVGFLGYCMEISQGRSSSYSALFDGFGNAAKIIWLTILMSVFIMLWTLLFIIPGIIASYRYRMAYFVLLDNPDMTAMEALHASKQMMVGHKMDLFVMDLSFIGWALLGILTLGILYLWLTPYIQTANANFYWQAKAETMNQGELPRF